MMISRLYPMLHFSGFAFVDVSRLGFDERDSLFRVRRRLERESRKPVSGPFRASIYGDELVWAGGVDDYWLAQTTASLRSLYADTRSSARDTLNAIKNGKHGPVKMLTVEPETALNPFATGPDGRPSFFEWLKTAINA